MPRKKKSAVSSNGRRRYTDEFKEEAIQMLLDGHTAPSVKERLGLPNCAILDRWKQEQLARCGPVAGSLEARVRELETELGRVERERDVLKSVGHFRPQRITDVYAAVETIVGEGVAAVSEVCRVLGVNRTSYYAGKTSAPTVCEEQEAQLSPLVRVLFKKHRCRYGARRIASDLRERGHRCSDKKVSKVMKTLGLKAIQPKSFVPQTTDSNHRLGYSPNLLAEADDPTNTNQIGVGDITYIPLVGGTFCYLAMLMDLYSRRIVGWKLREDMTEALTRSALQMAIRARQPGEHLIHHTDRGGQYAGHEYRAILRRAGMRQSMSRADNCYDNAFMESCFGTIKTELAMTEYENRKAARKEIAEYLRYYDLERRHSSLEDFTPNQFEQLMNHSK